MAPASISDAVFRLLQVEATSKQVSVLTYYHHSLRAFQKETFSSYDARRKFISCGVDGVLAAELAFNLAYSTGCLLWSTLYQEDDP